MKIAARIALVLGIGVILALTLSPHNDRTQRTGDRAVHSIRRHVQKGDVDLIGNLLLFAPAGVIALLAFPDQRTCVLLAGPLVSAAIEVSQGVWLPHRNASARDVAANSTGYLAGVAAATLARRHGPRGPAQ